jgi:hypothetical protein
MYWGRAVYPVAPSFLRPPRVEAFASAFTSSRSSLALHQAIRMGPAFAPTGLQERAVRRPAHKALGH